MIWTALLVYILLLLFVDFFILRKSGHTPTTRQASIESLFFIANGLLFSIVIYFTYANEWVANTHAYSPISAMLKYISGYLIELSLSVDNLFVIAVIFKSFKIPEHYQHKLLFMGILGAIILRGLLIGAGITLFEKVSGMNIIFGLFLLYTAFKMLKDEPESEHAPQPWWAKKLNISKEFNQDKFTIIKDGKRLFTPMFGALIIIEFTDLLFALDSIPAILAITSASFIVYSSNIFAILGLRSLYFFLSKMLNRFQYLKYSVFAILIFVGVKLMAHHYIDLPEWFSLSFIAVALGLGVYVSSVGNARGQEK